MPASTSAGLTRDVDAVLEDLAAWTRAADQPFETYAYGRRPEQVGDLRLPSTPAPHPVAVVVHGGFWRSRFTRRNTEAIAVALVHRGYATWNVEYRSVGSGGGVPETLDDIEAAIRHLDSICEPLDREPPLVIGHSAGGQLALWAASAGLASATVALAAVCDLAAAWRSSLGEGAVADFVGGTPSERAAAYDRADPARLVPTGVPTLLVHGDADDRVPLQQSREHAARARAAGDDCRLLVLAGADHFDLIDPRTSAWAELTSQLDAPLRTGGNSAVVR